MAKTPEEMLLDEFDTRSHLPWSSVNFQKHKELRAEILKRMTPATPAPIAAQTEKEMDCDCPCDECAIGTGKHCGEPPCDISKAEQVDAARLGKSVMLAATKIHDYLHELAVLREFANNTSQLCPCADRISHFAVILAASLKQETQPPSQWVEVECTECLMTIGHRAANSPPPIVICAGCRWDKDYTKETANARG